MFARSSLLGDVAQNQFIGKSRHISLPWVAPGWQTEGDGIAIVNWFVALNLLNNIEPGPTALS